jgi:hypothetical protein
LRDGSQLCTILPGRGDPGQGILDALLFLLQLDLSLTGKIKISEEEDGEQHEADHGIPVDLHMRELKRKGKEGGPIYWGRPLFI